MLYRCDTVVICWHDKLICDDISVWKCCEIALLLMCYWCDTDVISMWHGCEMSRCWFDVWCDIVVKCWDAVLFCWTCDADVILMWCCCDKRCEVPRPPPRARNLIMLIIMIMILIILIMIACVSLDFIFRIRPGRAGSVSHTASWCR